MILNLDALRAGRPAAQHALHCEIFQRNVKQHEATAFKSIQCKPSNIGANPMSFFTFWELLAVASVHLAEIQQEDVSSSQAHNIHFEAWGWSPLKIQPETHHR